MTHNNNSKTEQIRVSLDHQTYEFIKYFASKGQSLSNLILLFSKYGILWSLANNLFDDISCGLIYLERNVNNMEYQRKLDDFTIKQKLSEKK